MRWPWARVPAVTVCGGRSGGELQLCPGLLRRSAEGQPRREGIVLPSGREAFKQAYFNILFSVIIIAQ